MSAEITKVDAKSPAARAGIRAGDVLLKIDGHTIADVLDYKFYSYDADITVTLAERSVRVRKGEGEDMGLTFTSYLMDSAKRCGNKCVFCFIDQMPPGMRETLYFKDDDARMSFLMGNYISLTNLSEQDVERIIRMRLSPLNISVQVTEPELRCKMLGNPKAGQCMDILARFAQADLM
ncbi:MAG: PDZ domain-containing protein, partial [Clostridia bacterium]